MVISDISIPILLRRFMESTGKTERWVTVHEIRTHFGLDQKISPAISSFLLRCYARKDHVSSYQVVRIERSYLEIKPHPRTVNKYLIVKGSTGMENSATSTTGELGGYNRGVFTDRDALDHLDRVLCGKGADKKW